MRGSKSKFVRWNEPERPCKYNVNKECFNYNSNSCEGCSHNPYKFDNKEITQGQIKYLVSMGYDEKEVSKWDFKKAYQEIEKYKK